MGALPGQVPWRLTRQDNNVVSREERFKGSFGRIGDVRQEPDERLDLLTDDSDGRLIRIER